MSSTTYLPKLYLRLLNLTRSLPRDPLRPTLQLSSTLEAAVHQAFGVDPIPRLPSSGAGGGTSATSAEAVRGLTDSPSHAGAVGGDGEAALGRARHIDEQGTRLLVQAADALEAIKADKAMREVGPPGRWLLEAAQGDTKADTPRPSRSTHSRAVPSLLPRIPCTIRVWFKALSSVHRARPGRGTSGSLRSRARHEREAGGSKAALALRIGVIARRRERRDFGGSDEQQQHQHTTAG